MRTVMPTIERYGVAQRLLHWGVMLLVVVVFPLGAVIKFVKDDVKLGFYMLHESFGFIVLWLMLARLAVRLANPPPPHPATMPPFLEKVAGTVHVLLYVALIAQPILGFLMTNAYGFPLRLFDLVPIWSPIGKDEVLAGYLKLGHVALGWAILALVAGHIGGALYHHVIRRDETLYRML